jgi:hypothetical protein
MEQAPFELTPEQKGILASLSRETGKPIPALLAEALEVLQEHEHLGRVKKDDAPSSASGVVVPQRPPTARKLFWEKLVEASRRIPDEELDKLPPDLAAQIDHYVYGTPKR